MILLLFLLLPKYGSADVDCPCDGVVINSGGQNHCWEVRSRVMRTWVDGDLTCQSVGGHLGHPESDFYGTLTAYIKEVYAKPILTGYMVGNVEDSFFAMMCPNNKYYGMADADATALMPANTTGNSTCAFITDQRFMIQFLPCDTDSHVLCDRPMATPDYCNILMNCTHTTTTITTTTIKTTGTSLSTQSSTSSNANVTTAFSNSSTTIDLALVGSGANNSNNTTTASNSTSGFSGSTTAISLNSTTSSPNSSNNTATTTFNANSNASTTSPLTNNNSTTLNSNNTTLTTSLGNATGSTIANNNSTGSTVSPTTNTGATSGNSTSNSSTITVTGSPQTGSTSNVTSSSSMNNTTTKPNTSNTTATTLTSNSTRTTLPSNFTGSTTRSNTTGTTTFMNSTASTILSNSTGSTTASNTTKVTTSAFTGSTVSGSSTKTNVSTTASNANSTGSTVTGSTTLNIPSNSTNISTASNSNSTLTTTGSTSNTTATTINANVSTTPATSNTTNLSSSTATWMNSSTTPFTGSTTIFFNGSTTVFNGSTTPSGANINGTTAMANFSSSTSISIASTVSSNFSTTLGSGTGSTTPLNGTTTMTTLTSGNFTGSTTTVTTTTKKPECPNNHFKLIWCIHWRWLVVAMAIIALIFLACLIFHFCCKCCISICRPKQLPMVNKPAAIVDRPLPPPAIINNVTPIGPQNAVVDYTTEPKENFVPPRIVASEPIFVPVPVYSERKESIIGMHVKEIFITPPKPECKDIGVNTEPFEVVVENNKPIPTAVVTKDKHRSRPKPIPPRIPSPIASETEDLGDDVSIRMPQSPGAESVAPTNELPAGDVIFLKNRKPGTEDPADLPPKPVETMQPGNVISVVGQPPRMFRSPPPKARDAPNQEPKMRFSPISDASEEEYGRKPTFPSPPPKKRERKPSLSNSQPDLNKGSPPIRRNERLNLPKDEEQSSRPRSLSARGRKGASLTPVENIAPASSPSKSPAPLMKAPSVGMRAPKGRHGGAVRAGGGGGDTPSGWKPWAKNGKVFSAQPEFLSVD